MARGGPRPNAGRKKGGANAINYEARRRAAEGGLLPLEYLLSVMRDDTLEQAARVDAAKAAAPYVHAKLANVSVAGDPDKPLIHEIRRTLVRPNSPHG